MDQSGTINPAALNAPAAALSTNILNQSKPRGTKRSRSPDTFSSYKIEGELEDPNKAKRSRIRTGASPATSSQMSLANATSLQPVQTPQIKNQGLPQTSPPQASPRRTTPSSAAKVPVVKALPTVRDHTTDQLGPEGDEYLPREFDGEGETKVSKDGYALDGRRYKCRTFQVPNRGEKLFMLATECARVLGYRDSYLLFNKNRSLFKIIANQTEKDNLIQQEILPYSYRSRQIAIVTARSMFRQFGSRLIEGGRRVRDDYWETKARKQGFTEEDAAGEKRPGAAKAREQAAAEASHATALTSLPRGEITYSEISTGLDGQPPNMGAAPLAPLPMIHLPSEEIRPNAIGNIVRPRQEITGPPYTDRTQPSSGSEILSQSSQAAEFNKQLGRERAHRANYLGDYWRRPHEQPVTESQPPPGQTEMNTLPPQNLQSPQAVSSIGSHRMPQQDPMTHGGSQMQPRSYPSYQNPQHAITSPVQSMHSQLPPTQLSHNSPPLGMSSGPGHRQTPSYGGYSQNQMWPPSQAQQSPMPQPHVPAYNQQPQHASPMPPPPPMQQQPNMGYGQMNQMPNQPYTAMNRNVYQPNPGQQQFMVPQSGAGQQPGMQQWSTPGNLPPAYGGGYHG